MPDELDSKFNQAESLRKCSVCEANQKVILCYEVLNKISTQLMQCSQCSFISTDNPYWLNETFKNELQTLDLGSVDRCEVVLNFCEGIIRSQKISKEKFIDWGGGYGLLTRMARDRGLDYFNFDPFVKPLFAGNAQLSELEEVDLVSSSEVFLHLTDPVGQLKSLLKVAPIVVMTAVVPPSTIDTDWWYLMPETGQHVSFYPVRALRKMATLTNSFLETDGKFFHVFSRQKLSLRTRLAIRYRILAFSFSFALSFIRLIKRAFGKGYSLTISDQKQLIRK